jgi:acyl carrier protein
MMTDETTLRAVIFECLQAVAPEAEPAALDATRAFHDQIDMDSVDYLNFVLTLEKRLGVRIAEADFPQLSSLDGCLAYFRRAAGCAPSAAAAGR